MAFFGKGSFAPAPPPPSTKKDAENAQILAMLKAQQDQLNILMSRPGGQTPQTAAMQNQLHQIQIMLNQGYDPNSPQIVAMQNQLNNLAQRVAHSPIASSTGIVTGTTSSTGSSLYTQVKQEERAEQVATHGGEVVGSGGKSVKDLLAPDATQVEFTRSTTDPNSNLLPNDWRRLGPPPEGYDEAKYLARHPDVAEAVKIKAMPSGLYHYLKFGKQEGRDLAGWNAGRRRTQRRPGYLSGISSNWRQRG